MFTTSIGLIESFSVILLLKVIPEWDEEISSNNVCFLWHAESQNKQEPININLKNLHKISSSGG